MQAVGGRDGSHLSNNFIWLTSSYDVNTIAQRLDKPWSEIENILVDDMLMRRVTVFYIPDGTHKKYPYATFRHRPRHVLEQFFLDDIYERPLAWDWVWASVTRHEKGMIDDHYLLYLEARVDGFTRYCQIRIHIYDLVASRLDKDEFFALAWDDMIRALDHEYKLARYGPRR